jgi:serine/threonine protein kinase
MTNRYKFYDKLGAGGVGTIYRAFDTQLKRWVAIKRLSNHNGILNNHAPSTDLRKEADSLASLRHPNIVTIFDVGEDELGIFLVMELLEGDDLGDVLIKSPFTEKDFRELVIQTMEGMASAHHRGFLHRDIKPENIKIERMPSGRLQAKIIDFGLARAGGSSRKQTESVDGTVMGSIYYMAPEQLSREPVDVRTDLYSFGVVFYEALSGLRAFDGELVEEVINRHLTHDVTYLNQIEGITNLCFAGWVHHLMALLPIHRPSSTEDALEKFLSWSETYAKDPLADGPWLKYMPPTPPHLLQRLDETNLKAPAVSISSPPTLSAQIVIESSPLGSKNSSDEVYDEYAKTKLVSIPNLQKAASPAPSPAVTASPAPPNPELSNNPFIKNSETKNPLADVLTKVAASNKATTTGIPKTDPAHPFQASGKALMSDYFAPGAEINLPEISSVNLPKPIPPKRKKIGSRGFYILIKTLIYGFILSLYFVGYSLYKIGTLDYWFDEIVTRYLPYIEKMNPYFDKITSWFH